MRTKVSVALAIAFVAAGAAIWILTRSERWIGARWATDVHGALDEWSAAMDLRETFETLPGDGAAVASLVLLDRNPDAWVERWRLVAEARHRIDAATFIVRDDVFGLAFLGHLLERAQSGVRVRVLVDAYGTTMARSLFDEDYLDELVAAGVDVRVYRPLLARFVQAVARFDVRAMVASEHDKILRVDERAAIVGGRNVGREYYADPRRDPRAFLDAEVLVRSELVARRLGIAFEAEWQAAVAVPIEQETVDIASRQLELIGAKRAMDAWLRGAVPHHPDAHVAPHLTLLSEQHAELYGRLREDLPGGRPAEQGEVRVVNSVPRVGVGDDQVSRSLVRLLTSARRSVMIASPYVVLPEPAVERLARAARRGVALTIATNSPVSSDNALSQAVFLAHWPELLARVPELRLFARADRHNVHAKLAVFDDQIAVIGTYNLDPISMLVNGEVALVVWSKEFAAQIRSSIEEMAGGGRPTALEYAVVRDASGDVVRGADGAPRIASGPDDHGRPASVSLVLWSAALRLARLVAPSSEMFWAARAQTRHAQRAREPARLAAARGCPSGSGCRHDSLPEHP